MSLKMFAETRLVVSIVTFMFISHGGLFANSDVTSETDLEDLDFLVEPSTTVAFRDKPVVLQCGVESHGISGTVSWQWLKDGERLVPSSRRQVLSNGSLVIESPVEEGLYLCMVSVSGVGSIISRSASVHLAYLDRAFSEEPQNVSARLGDVVMLACAIRGAPSPQIQWLKDDVEIDTQSINFFVHPVEQGRAILEIRNLQSSDLGRYRCRASNGDRTKDSYTGVVSQNVVLPSFDDMQPQFAMRPNDSAVREGDDLFLYCGTNGQDRHGKRPTIVWLKDGITIDMSDHFSLVGDGSLKITHVEEDDAGLYTCRASHLEETVDTNAGVTILVPPKLQVLPRRIVAQERSDQELACVVYGTPRPTVQWYRNGLLIVQDDYVQVVEGHNLRIMGLLKSDEGMYQCVATNIAGSAQASSRLTVIERAVSLTRDGTLSMPTELTAVIVSTRFVTLSWKPKASEGLTDTTGYIVSWKESGSTRVREINATSLEANIQHLRPSTRYVFEVRACNAIGCNQNAAQLPVQTQDEAQVPDPPRNLLTTPLSSTSIAVTWNASRVNTTSSVAGYKLYYYEIGDETLEKEVVLDIKSVRHVLADLKKFRQYSIRVAAFNGVGLGMSTDEVVCQTLSDVPSISPQNVSVEVQSDSSVIVNWDPLPEEHANGMLTGYRVEYKQTKDDSRAGVAVTDANQRTTTLMDLTQGVEYSFSLAALTRNGSGPASAWITASTHIQNLGELTVPAAPSSLHVRPQTNSIVVSWSPPLDQNVLVRGYILGYGAGIPDVYRQIFDAKQRYHTIKGLRPSLEYVISLKAFNAAGEGNPVYETTITREETTPEPLTPMIPPVGLKAVVLSPSAIVLTWTDTTLGRNQRITDNRFYTVRYTPRVQRKPKSINSSDLNVHIDDLKPDTEYEFSVKVVKGMRQSTWSLSVLNRTKEAAPSSAPRDVTVAFVDDRLNWVSLSWQPPRQANGQITGYLIFYTTDATLKDRDWVVEGVLGDRLSATIQDLSLDTTYYFKVQSQNKIGPGPVSPTVVFQTPLADGTGGGLIEMPDDYGKLPRGKDPLDTRNTLVTSSSATNTNIPNSVVWISIGCIGGITFVALIIILAIVCNRKRTVAAHNSRQGYMPANKPKTASKDIKPPDLWIHDRMEMKEATRSEEIDEGTAMMSREAHESKDDDFDSNTSESDRFRRLPHRIKPVMIPVDQPPPTREPYLPVISNGIMDSNTVVVRPVYPRTQYGCQYAGAPRVNAGQLPPQSSGTPGRSALPNSPGGGCSKSGYSSSTSGAASGFGTSRDVTTGAVPLPQADNLSDSKSYTAEELTAEMANLEGLMKDLSAITQHEFEC